MLAGATITDEARAAAARLLKGAGWQSGRFGPLGVDRIARESPEKQDSAVSRAKAIV